MRIIPVIDLQGGLVVRGIAGARETYRPLQSRIAESADPGNVAQGLVTTFGATEIYVADLDAIAGHDPAWGLYGQIAGAGTRLWVDAGLRDTDRAAKFRALADQGVPLAAIIAGLETLPSPALLGELLAAIGPDRFVFSLDLKDGRPILAEGAQGWQADPLEIAASALETGLRRMIVLDLAGVGTGEGLQTLELCRRLKASYPDLELTTGGGVRDVDDLHEIREAGCDAALVASALHDGRITAVDVAEVLSW